MSDIRRMLAVGAPMPPSHHLELYYYWLARRGLRSMPARGDLNPGDIPALLPHLMLVDKLADGFRYRLVGSSITREVGHDATGSLVGSYVGITTPAVAASVNGIYDRVFTSARPIFSTGEFTARTGALFSLSLLLLPLSGDGTNVNMAVASLGTHPNFDLAPKSNWLHGLPVRVLDISDVEGPEMLERLCLDWQRHCDWNERSRNR
jgi:hypothetical protein